MAPHHWQLTIDVQDPTTMVAFWAPALGYVVQAAPRGHATWNDYYLSVGVPEDELDLDGDGADRIEDPSGRGPAIWFQVVPETKSVKNRLHLDVFVTDKHATSYAERRPLVEERVAELVTRGASVRGVTDDEANAYFAVGMRDPEGNEFCVS